MQLQKIDEERQKLEQARIKMRQKVMAKLEEKKSVRKFQTEQNELHSYDPKPHIIDEREEDVHE
jgi:hypothetical protein